jgi:hypothetical protein
MLMSAFSFLRMLISGEQEEPLLLDKQLPPAPKDGDRAVHSPQYQVGHHVPSRKPACWTDSDTSPRGEVVEGWQHGVKPGFRNPFSDNGRSCQNASTPELWATALALTPTCLGCQRAQRALDITAGLIQPDT